VHKLDYTVAVSRRRKPAIRSEDARVSEVPVDWSKALDNFAEGIEIIVRVS
jgi:anaerobic selenocysteine-containing dehydrogenase